MKYTNMFRNDKGVSEAIGFMLILGIMVTGIGLITLYGYPILLQQQKDANVRNMERNMIVIQNDMNSLTFKNVPYKESSLQVSGGTLSVTDPATYTHPYFTIRNSTDTMISIFKPGDIRFNSDDGNAEIMLENGAVNLAYLNEGGSAMISEPRWYYDSSTQTFVIYLIQVNKSDIGSSTVSNSVGNVQMIVTPLIPDIDQAPGGGNYIDVIYNYDTTNDFRQSWDNYFVNTLQMVKDNSTSPATYRMNNVQRVVIKSYNIQVLNV